VTRRSFFVGSGLAVAGVVVVGAIQNGVLTLLAPTWHSFVDGVIRAAAQPIGSVALWAVSFLVAWVALLTLLGWAEVSARPAITTVFEKSRSGKIRQGLVEAKARQKGLLKEADDARAETLRFIRDWTDMRWRLLFRTERVSFDTPVSPEESGEIEKLRPHVQVLMTALREVARVVVDSARSAGPTGEMAADHVQDISLRPLQCAYEMLEFPEREDLRIVFLTFYRKYREASWWLSELSCVVGPIGLPGIVSYRAWFAADQAFLQRQREALSMRSLARLRQEVQSIEQEGRNRFGLPEPHPAVPG
jgi:hypothetical protein